MFFGAFDGEVEEAEDRRRCVLGRFKFVCAAALTLVSLDDGEGMEDKVDATLATSVYSLLDDVYKLKIEVNPRIIISVDREKMLDLWNTVTDD